jgi:hypothetical protein
MDKSGFISSIRGKIRNTVEAMPYYSGNPLTLDPMTWYTALLIGTQAGAAALYWPEAVGYIQISIKNLNLRNPPTNTSDIEFWVSAKELQLTDIEDAKAQQALAALPYVSDVLVDTYIIAQPVSGSLGANIALMGTIYRAGTSAALVGKEATFTFNGHTIYATGDSAGLITCTFPASYCPTTAGTYSYAIAFPGDVAYNGSNATGTVTLGAAKTTPLISCSSVSAPVGSDVAINALLRSSAGVGISGKTISITFYGITYYTSVTDGGGNGTLTVPAYKCPQSPGTYNVTASFAGDGDYNSAVTSCTVTLTAVSGSFLVRFATVPTGASVTVDGVNKGLT